MTEHWLTAASAAMNWIYPAVVHIGDWFTIEDAQWLKMIRIISILTGFYVATRVLLFVVERHQQRFNLLMTKDKLLDIDQKRIITISAFIRNTIMLVILITVLLIVMDELGVNIAPLIAGASIFGVAAGLGAQTIAKDIFYGFIILLENQFRIGDTVQAGDSTGVVEAITLRTLTLRDGDGKVHIIPNGEASRIIVHSRDWSAMTVNLEVPNTVKIDDVFEILNQVNTEFGRENAKKLLGPPQTMGLDALRPKSYQVRIFAKTKPQKHLELSRLYLQMVKTAFAKASIDLTVA